MNQDQNNKNFKNFIIYNIPAWAPSIIIFLLLPIYTAYLTPEEFGIRAIILLAILLFQIISNFGVNWTIRAKYFSFKTNNERNAYFSTILFISILIHTIIFLFLYFYNDFFPYVFKNWNIFYSNLFKVQLFIFLLSSFDYCFQPIFIMEHLSLKYSIITLINYFLNIGLSLLLLVHYEMGIFSLFYGELAGIALSVTASLFLLRKKIIFKFEKRAIVDLLKIGLPAVPKNLFSQIQTNINKYFLQIYLPLNDLGIFAKSEFLYKGTSNIQRAFANAFSPTNIEKILEDGKDEYTNGIMIYWHFLISGIYVFCTLFLLNVFKIMNVNESFFLCAKYAPYIGFYFVVTSYSMVYENYLLVGKKTYLITVKAIIGGLINIIANILLIPLLGLIGVIISSSISSAFAIFIEYYFCKKLLNVKINLNFKIYFIITSIVVTLYILTYFDVIISLYAKTIIMIIYILFFIIYDMKYSKKYFYNYVKIKLGFRGIIK